MDPITDLTPSPAPHPGVFVRSRIIGPKGLTVTDAAYALGVHRVALSRFLNEQASLSCEMAIRLEKAFGADMEFLMRMQNEYDIAQAKLKFDSVEVARAVDAKPQALLDRTRSMPSGLTTNMRRS